MNLTAELSYSSLAALEKRLRGYADGLDEKSGQLAEELAETAVSAAKEKCPSERVTETIGSRRTADGAEAFANGPVLSPADGSYDVPLSHILESGWTYQKDDGTFGFTHGHIASRFMGAGADEARSEVVNTAKRIFKS